MPSLQVSMVFSAVEPQVQVPPSRRRTAPPVRHAGTAQVWQPKSSQSAKPLQSLSRPSLQRAAVSSRVIVGAQVTSRRTRSVAMSLTAPSVGTVVSTLASSTGGSVPPPREMQAVERSNAQRKKRVVVIGGISREADGGASSGPPRHRCSVPNTDL